jgi:dephospho-CoA kinase
MITQTDKKIVVVDAALIPLWKIEHWFDNLVWISASFNSRLSRLQKETTFTKEELVNRINIQQQLFHEPQQDRWNTVENEGGRNEFFETLDRLWNDKVPETVKK